MTECSVAQVTISRHRRRAVLANLDGGHITADAGLLLLRAADRNLGLLDRLAECLTDWRDPARIRHDLRTMLAQRVLAIAGGYEDGNDHQALRHDRLIKLIAEANLQVEATVRTVNVSAEASALYEQVYCRRGEMENRIKEQQLDLFADRTSCSKFLANQFRLPLSSAAYVRFEHLRRVALKETELA